MFLYQDESKAGEAKDATSVEMVSMSEADAYKLGSQVAAQEEKDEVSVKNW